MTLRSCYDFFSQGSPVDGGHGTIVAHFAYDDRRRGGIADLAVRRMGLNAPQIGCVARSAIVPTGRDDVGVGELR